MGKIVLLLPAQSGVRKGVKKDPAGAYRFGGIVIEQSVYVPDPFSFWGAHFVCPVCGDTYKGLPRKEWKMGHVERVYSPSHSGSIGNVCLRCGAFVVSSHRFSLVGVHVPKSVWSPYELPPFEKGVV
jgi:hypothetical protein